MAKNDNVMSLEDLRRRTEIGERLVRNAGQPNWPEMHLLSCGDQLEGIFGPVYRAGTIDDLRWELNELYDSPEYWDVCEQMVRASDRQPAKEIALNLSAEGQSYRASANYYIGILNHHRALIETAATQRDASASGPPLPGHPESVHPTLVAVTREFAAGAAAWMTLRAASHLNFTVSQRNQDELMRSHACGVYAALRVMSFFGEMPTDIVPDSDQLNLLKLHGQCEQFTDWCSEQARKVVIEGQSREAEFLLQH